MEVLKNEHNDMQKRRFGGNADRYGRQGVPLGVLELHAGACERLDK